MVAYGAEFMPDEALRELGFASLGENVKIYPSVILVGTESAYVGSRSRIDAHTIITAASSVLIGAYVDIGASCYLAGTSGITMENLSILSQGVKFTRSMTTIRT